ncbi:MAG: DUF1801 domain-containing protein [Gammaproteobacteria bacterium]|nr:DUF1801 domain-containing protein [Gammaproteobacteria bacterium]
MKTVPTKASVAAFLGQLDDAKRRDAETVAAIMEEVTGAPAVMWGSSIVGFGRYHYRYASGREGDFFVAGFAPRKRALTLYIMAGFAAYDALLLKLGKFTVGKSCLYVKRLADVDLAVLRELIEQSAAAIRDKYPDEA